MSLFKDDVSVTIRTEDEYDMIGDWEDYWYPATLPETFVLQGAEKLGDESIILFVDEANDGGLGWYHEFPHRELGYSSRAVVFFELDSIGGAKYKYGHYDDEDYSDGCQISAEYVHDGTPGFGSLSIGIKGVGIGITPGAATL